MTSAEQTEAIRQSMQDDKATKDEVIRELVEALQWYIENDETNEGSEPIRNPYRPSLNGQTWDEINGYWIAGKRRAEAALRKAGAL